ncbi:tetratricopeptide repeat protein [Paracrocinitomix mangrovi]|uniref:type IX secretion system periplasmic lipoprotein PorW/SprE n=1 Tax=Paracrocinitomix mangrovi TaxID=2862509 RepID=UPI001C8E80B3|nr:tetratricopeptide repeat protein [Paracrocinitomix mangrovi]UKN00430.1 tetratricopeptide repeat protein [Paracrocinitomix mangrovi]
MGLILVSCSTEKDAALNIGYHNMTAKYNGYFNAKEIMAEALDSYRNTLNEDYHNILPLDVFPSEEDVAKIREPYEDAFSRCEVVIQRHSMPSSATRNKGEEHCRWIDDNWFVIGVIHYTKRDYADAEEIFSFIQESPLYVDQERVHEARIWLARTYIAQGRYPEAKRILAQVERDMESAAEPKEKEKLSGYAKKKAKQQAKLDKKNKTKKPAPFPGKKLTDDYNVVMAEYYMAQKNYIKAIPHVEEAIKFTKKKKTKARYTFVLAQLYKKTGNGEQASFYFNKVVKSSAPYVMRFQAQIYKALSLPSGGQEIRDELKKMLKDPKNDEYKDQIYYALADIEMKSGNKELAMENYSLSAFYSINNNRQKGMSYLALGDIYFKDQDYLKAQKYYDSCVQVLPEEYETYEQIKGKAEGLSDLVVNYETYVFEDSVQQKAQMSPEELDKYLAQQLKDMKAAEQKRKEEEEQRLKEQQRRIKSATTNTGSGSKWYFYNQKVSSSGFNDFRALWGQREDEDDWRRSNKTSFSSLDVNDPEVVDSLENLSNIDTDSLAIEQLRANIPLSDSAMTASNDRLMNALYMLGIIYKEQLKQEGEAITYFKKCVDRKVEHPKVLPALYQLYLIYNKKGSSEANRYKEEILNNYANSEVALMIQDPDYFNKKAEKDKADLNAYGKTLEDYRLHRYSSVILQCNRIIENDTTNQFLNKYYLLKAYAVSNSSPGNAEAIRGTLEKLYAMSPESEEGKQAKEMLDKLDKGLTINTSNNTNQNENQNATAYVYDEELEHYFVLIYPEDLGNINKPKTQLSNFNQDFFKSSRLKIITTEIGGKQVLLVRSFDKQDNAHQYKLAFESTPAKTSIGNLAEKADFFLINSTNFQRLMKDGDIDLYKTFYKEKYP